VKTPQFELPQSGDAFNLAGEQAVDPWRIERDRIAEEERRRQAAEYQRKVQLTLEQCPGFSGCDAPASQESKGVVVVEPGRLAEAWSWLRKRYHVCESLELYTDQGIAIQIAPRIRRVTAGKPRRKVSFGQTVQYELAFA
jgi:hypothetical protein